VCVYIYIYIHTHRTAQFLMWHTITFLITVIIYLFNPQLLTGHVLWQFVYPQPSYYKGLHKHCISRVQKESYELAGTVFKLTFSVHSVPPYFSHVTCFPLITANLRSLSPPPPLSLSLSLLYSTLHNQKILPNWRGFIWLSVLYMINFSR
jgi:hypothetical protein